MGANSSFVLLPMKVMKSTHTKNNASNQKASPVIVVMFYLHFNTHLCWDLGPQSGVFNWCNRFLWISVDVHVKH